MSQLKPKGEIAATKTANRKAAAYAATWMVASVRNSRLRGETAAASMTPVETVGVRTCQRDDVYQSAPHQ